MLKIRGILCTTICTSACCEINITHKVRLDSCMHRLRMHLFFRTLGKMLGHALWNKSVAQKCLRHLFRKACIVLQHDAWGCILGRSCLAVFPYTKHIFIHHIKKRREKPQGFACMFYAMYASVRCVCALPLEKTARTGCGLSWTVFIKFKSTIPPNLQWVSQEEWRDNEMKYHSSLKFIEIRNKNQFKLFMLKPLRGIVTRIFGRSLSVYLLHHFGQDQKSVPMNTFKW